MRYTFSPTGLNTSRVERVHVSLLACSSLFFLLQAEIPIQVIFPALFATIVYLLCGFALESKPYLLFVLYVVLTSNAAISLG